MDLPARQPSSSGTRTLLWHCGQTTLIGMATSTLREGRPEHRSSGKSAGKASIKSQRTCGFARWASEYQHDTTVRIAAGREGDGRNTRRKRSWIEADVLGVLFNTGGFWTDSVQFKTTVEFFAQLAFEENKEGKYEWKLTWERPGFEDRSMQSDRALGTLEEAKEDARADLKERAVTLLSRQSRRPNHETRKGATRRPCHRGRRGQRTRPAAGGDLPPSPAAACQGVGGDAVNRRRRPGGDADRHADPRGNGGPRGPLFLPVPLERLGLPGVEGRQGPSRPARRRTPA